MAGETPEHPISFAELERRVAEAADPRAAAYVLGGAGAEQTMRSNLEAFRRWRLVPRMLRDVSERDLSVTIAGTRMPAPVALAPIGVQSIVHVDGELAVARAAAAVGLTMTVSTASAFSLEEIAAAGQAPKWFQLYWPRNHELMESFVGRAERAGYEAIVLTVDTFLPGWKPRDLEGAWQPFLEGVGIANYTSDPVFKAAVGDASGDDAQAVIQHWVTIFPNPTLTWEDLGWLREQTHLPILLKGVLDEADAHRAVDAGVDGVIVSNHGGRQVDGSIASLEALPDVVGAVPEGFPVLLDSGIRTGADVFKALALGARAVLIGRPYAWGLALAGAEGVRHVLRGLLADFDLTMALTCHTSLDELGPDSLRRAPRA